MKVEQFFFVSHNMAMIENLCSRAILLQKGNLEREGKTSEVISHYLESTRKLSGIIARDIRGGIGGMRFRNCKILDKSGVEIGIIMSGVGFRIQIKFELIQNYKPIDPLVIIKLKSSTDIPLFVQHNLLHNYHLTNLSKENCIECNLKEFPFPAGAYYLDLRIIDNGTLLDEIENAIEIIVEQSNYFESGEIPDAKYGIALVRADWQLSGVKCFLIRLEFIFLFFPLTFFLYYVLLLYDKGKIAFFLLLFSSLFFYGYWNPKYLCLIIVSIVINYCLAKVINSKRIQENLLKKRYLLTSGIVINIGTLGYFKYTNFIVANINHFGGFSFAVENIVLPLAISFFTFQQIAFLVGFLPWVIKEYGFINYALSIHFSHCD